MEAGKFTALSNDIIEVGLAGNIAKPKNEAADDHARWFDKKVLRGKLLAAVREATECDRGGLSKPFDTCDKTQQPVIDVLHAKHPEPTIPNLSDHRVSCFGEYDNGLLDFIPALIAQWLRGGAGPSGVDVWELKGWLLRHGNASEHLRHMLDME